MSLDVITVTLNMDTVNFLGISIVGQSSSRGDNGIYVANIMKGVKTLIWKHYQTCSWYYILAASY